MIPLTHYETLQPGQVYLVHDKEDRDWAMWCFESAVRGHSLLVSWSGFTVKRSSIGPAISQAGVERRRFDFYPIDANTAAACEMFARHGEQRANGDEIAPAWYRFCARITQREVVE